jgi:hypothetical protein
VLLHLEGASDDLSGLDRNINASRTQSTPLIGRAGFRPSGSRSVSPHDRRHFVRLPLEREKH